MSSANSKAGQDSCFSKVPSMVATQVAVVFIVQPHFRQPSDEMSCMLHHPLSDHNCGITQPYS